MLTIVDDIREYLTKYVAFNNENHSLILAMWALHTWVFEYQNTTPYIYLSSQEKQSGKSLTLEVLETITKNPVKSTDMTPAVMFRLIDKFKPTIMLDEVDTIFNGKANEHMRGLINTGYKKGGNVYRCDASTELGVVPYSTFSPKILAGIDNKCLPDTIADRCIPIKLTRISQEDIDSDRVETFYAEDAEEEANALLDKMVDATIAIVDKVSGIRPDEMKNIKPRQWEISRPLVSLAMLIDPSGELESDLKSALVEAFESEDSVQNLSVLQTVLTDIKEIFDDMITLGDKFPDKIHTDAIISKLNEKSGGERWTGKLLSKVLEPIKIRPTTIRRGNQVLKGYKKEQFMDAWTRFV